MCVIDCEFAETRSLKGHLKKICGESVTADATSFGMSQQDAWVGNKMEKWRRKINSVTSYQGP